VAVAPAPRLDDQQYSPLRFNTRFLAADAVAAHFATVTAAVLTPWASVFRRATMSCTPDHRQALADAAYAAFLAAMHTAADQVLGRRPPVASRRPPPPSDPVRWFRATFANTGATIAPSLPGADVLDEALNHFRCVYSCQSPLPNLPPPLPLADFDPSTLAFLDAAFGSSAVTAAITAYPSGKAIADDGIDAAILKALRFDPEALHALSALFLGLALLGCVPAQWKHSVLHPIPKCPNATVAQSRPIAVTSMLRRVFESCLLRGITAATLHTTPLPDHLLAVSALTKFSRLQAGFRPGHSTTANILLAGTSSCAAFVFMDLKSAYDSVDLALLLALLRDRGLPPALLAIFAALFVGTSSSIVLNKQRSPPFPRQRGVFQGSLLSPLLFNVYIDALACALDTGDDYIRAQLFADDIALLPRSQPELDLLLDRVVAWSAAAHVDINVAKCGVVLRSDPSIFAVIAGQPLPVVPWYPYLGVPFGPDGPDWTQFALRTARRAARFLQHALRHGQHLPHDARLTICKVFVRASADYCLPLFTWFTDSSHADAIRLLVNLHRLTLDWVFARAPVLANVCATIGVDALEQQLPVPLRRADNIADTLAGLGSFDRRSEELVLRTHLHLQSLAPDHPLRLPVFRPVLAVFEQAPLVLAYQASRADPRPLPLPDWIRQDRLTSFSRQRLRLATYILPTARLRPSLRDFSLTIPDAALRARAILWRRNRLFIGRRCPCGLAFTRAHVNRCDLLRGVAPHPLRAIFRRQLAQLGVTAVNGYAGGFTPIDTALNLRKPQLLRTLLDHLDACLLHFP